MFFWKGFFRYAIRFCRQTVMDTDRIFRMATNSFVLVAQGGRENFFTAQIRAGQIKKFLSQDYVNASEINYFPLCLLYALRMHSFNLLEGQR